MDNEEMELIELEDSDGQPVTLKVERYFFYNGEEYVLLSDDIDGTAAEEASFYVMKVEPIEGEDDDMVDFVPVDDELSEALLKAARTVFDPFDGKDDE